MKLICIELDTNCMHEKTIAVVSNRTLDGHSLQIIVTFLSFFIYLLVILNAML